MSARDSLTRRLRAQPSSLSISRRGMLLAVSAATVCVTAMLSRREHDSASETDETLVVSVSESIVTTEVARVIDGDTIVIDDGQRVRLIGIDAPESAHPDAERNTEAGEEASAFLKALLPEGTTIYLEYDAEREDNYGRTLAYVWLEEPDSDAVTANDVKEAMAQGIMLASGMAETMSIEPNTRYAAIFRAISEV